MSISVLRISCLLTVICCHVLMNKDLYNKIHIERNYRTEVYQYNITKASRQLVKATTVLK